MNEILFTAKLSARIHLSDAEFSLLWIGCEYHYDGYINSLIKLGGQLWGERTGRSLVGAKVFDLDLKFADTLLKALEGSQLEEVHRLRAKIRDIHFQLSKGTNYVNQLLKEKQKFL